MTTDREMVALAKSFHENYERLAPQFGYETRKASAVPWDDVPENNRALMVATVTAALQSCNYAGLVAALEAVEGAMLNGGDGQTGDYGWNVTKLNKARPLIRAALQLSDTAQEEQG